MATEAGLDAAEFATAARILSQAINGLVSGDGAGVKTVATHRDNDEVTFVVRLTTRDARQLLKLASQGAASDPRRDADLRFLTTALRTR